MVIVVLGLRNMKNAIVDELCMIDDVFVRCYVALLCSEPINIVLNHFGCLGDQKGVFG